MGQKVSPVGLRIGVNRDWESKWYAPTKDFAKYLNTDLKIRKYLDKELYNILINCTPDKQKLIYNIAKIVSGSNFV